MKKFKLVVADHDGTIANNERVVTSRTIETLERLHAEGYLFGLASGRTIEDVEVYPEKWGLSFDFDIIIGTGGGQIWDNLNKQLYNGEMLMPKDIKKIIEDLKPLGVYVCATNGEKFLAEGINELIDESIKRNDVANLYRVVDDISEFWQNPVGKIMYRTPADKMPFFEEYASKHPNENYWGFKTQSTMFEFAPKANTKGNALKKICNILNISLEEVIAFGDMTNDNDMLEICYGVCMKNGSEDTKRCAKEITEYTNEEDGFARYIEKYLL